MLLQGFFRLINFASFGVICYFVFKKYFLQDLRQAMFDLKKEKKERENSYYVLKNEREKIKQDIIAQQEEALQLRNKLNQWNEKIVTQKAMRDQIEATRYKKNEEQRITQSKNFLYNQMQRNLVTQALAQAEIELICKFKNGESSTYFIDTLCNKIQKDLV